MVQLLRFGFVLFSLIASSFAYQHDSCRQCHGTNVITFTKQILIVDAEAFLAGTFGQCATGGEYKVLGSNGKGCYIQDNVKYCSLWSIVLDAWRYCGNGPSVFLTNSGRCVGSVCSKQERLDLECTKSVPCHSDCDMDLCRNPE